MTKVEKVFLCFALLLFVGILVPSCNREKAKDPFERTFSNELILHTLILSYFGAEGHFPSKKLWVSELTTHNRTVYPTSSQLTSNIFIDGWGEQLIFDPSQSGRKRIFLYSVGQNGKDEGGSGDDLGTWDVSWQEIRGTRCTFLMERKVFFDDFLPESSKAKEIE